MLKQFAFPVIALVIAWPSQAGAQSQQSKEPIAKTAVAKTSAVKTRQKRSAVTRPSAAQRAVAASDLTTVVAPNGDVVVTRKKKIAR